ncbi:MAG: hypothetical protein DCF25_16130 [Leptolyngbya foveolarum]|uniref:Uncharacterized protein n=1 Tax=Leptolyngbya foveolarum TaxID=47253 RepID=A0A2W4U2K5_9CYAN|nr:MAG: hypothetical protein DCF25_16130 [Leptolyngbya foveolarum]
MQATVNNHSNYQANRLASRSAYWPVRSNRSSKKPQQSLRTQLKNLAQTFVCQLGGSSEPRVWSTQDANGQTVWNAQDSASNRIIRHVSETELRIWLEERYTF